jgi:hypothetical protein
LLVVGGVAGDGCVVRGMGERSVVGDVVRGVVENVVVWAVVLVDGMSS